MKKKNSRLLNTLSTIFLIIGGLNWGLAVFDFNLVTFLLGMLGMMVVNIVYGLVGVAAVVRLLFVLKVLK